MVNNRLKEIRLNKCITQEELARLVNCSLRTIQNIENDEGYNISMQLAYNIKHILGIDNIEFLFPDILP